MFEELQRVPPPRPRGPVSAPRDECAADAGRAAGRHRRALLRPLHEMARVQRDDPLAPRRRPGASGKRRRGRALGRDARRLRVRGRGRGHHRDRRHPVLAVDGPGRRGPLRRAGEGRVPVADVRKRLVHGQLRDAPGDRGRHEPDRGRHRHPHGELRVVPGPALHQRTGVPRAPRHVARRQPPRVRPAGLHVLPLPLGRRGRRRDGVPPHQTALGRDREGHAQAGDGADLAVRPRPRPDGAGPADAPRGFTRHRGRQVRSERVDPHVRLRTTKRLGVHGRVRLRSGRF
mmetsp:Transcript_16917/g.52712  ORF Transcript_16917/g.52712 Transcript_16917/m.52712 type:complete len:288 (+) Transcript_16917:902-1765(+)